MPVIVSLLELVRVEGTRSLWPAELRAFEERLQAEPAEGTHWGACADWLEEDHINEPQLAEAFRWVFKRLSTGLRVITGTDAWEKGQWKFESNGTDAIPGSIRGALGYSARAHTIAELMGQLAAAFAKLREEMF